MCSAVVPCGSGRQRASDEKSLVEDALAAELREQGSGLLGAAMRQRFIDIVGLSPSHMMTITFRPTRLCRKMNCRGSSSDCARYLADHRCAILRAVSTAKIVGGRTIMRLYLESPLVPAVTGREVR